MHFNTSIETIKILILDPIPLASMIERKAKPYLKEIKPIVKEKISIVYDMYGRALHVMDNNCVDDCVCVKQPLHTRGVEIIKSYINRILIMNSVWSKEEIPTITAMWSKYLIPEYEYTIEVYELIEGLMDNLRMEIIAFIGKDKWNIHLQRVRYNDIIIEKCTDFRIFWYNQNVGK